MGADAVQLLAGLGALVFVCTTIVLARVMPGERSLRMWAVAAIIITVSNVVGGLRGLLPSEDLAIVVSIALGVVGGVVLYAAIKDTFGLPWASRWIVYGAVLGLGYAVTFTYVLPSIAMRTVISGMLGALFGVLAARVFWQAHEPGITLVLKSTGAVLLLAGLAFAVRGFALLPSDVDSMSSWDSSLVVASTYVALTLACVWTAAAIVIIVSSRLRRELDEARAFAEDANARLLEMSWVDPLTGAATRPRIMAVLSSEVGLAHSAGSRLSVVMIAVSSAQHLSGQLGHRAGDAAMRCAAQVAQAAAPSDSLVDLVGRWGHDELLVVLPRTDSGEAMQYARRVSERVGDEGETGIAEFDCTFAVTSLKATDGGSDDLLARLDVALYRARDCGPNAVEVL